MQQKNINNFKSAPVVPGQTYCIRDILKRVSRGLGLPSYMVHTGAAYNGANNLSQKANPDNLIAIDDNLRKVKAIRARAMSEHQESVEAAKRSEKGTNTGSDVQQPPAQDSEQKQ